MQTVWYIILLTLNVVMSIVSAPVGAYPPVRPPAALLSSALLRDGQSHRVELRLPPEVVPGHQLTHLRASQLVHRRVRHPQLQLSLISLPLSHGGPARAVVLALVPVAHLLGLQHAGYNLGVARQPLPLGHQPVDVRGHDRSRAFYGGY